MYLLQFCESNILPREINEERNNKLNKHNNSYFDYFIHNKNLN